MPSSKAKQFKTNGPIGHTRLVSVDSDLKEHTGEGLKIHCVTDWNSGVATHHMDLNRF